MTRWADLSPADRKAIRGGKATRPEAPRRRATPDAPLGPDLASYRCRTCGLVLVGYLPCERHVLAEHGGGVVQVWGWQAEGAKLAAPPPETEPEDPTRCPPPPPP